MSSSGHDTLSLSSGSISASSNPCANASSTSPATTSPCSACGKRSETSPTAATSVSASTSSATSVSASTSSATSSTYATSGKRGATSPAFSPSKKAKIDDKPTTVEIEELLECTICLDFPSSPIYNCANAHILCGQCAPRFVACPTCRLPTLSISHLGEKLAKMANKKIDCVNVEAGCKESLLSTKLADHLPLCYFREVRCTRKNGKLRCGWKIQLNEYTRHLEDVHDQEIHIGPKFTKCYHNVEKNLGKVGWSVWNSVVKFESQEFVCHFQISRQSKLVFCWVSILGDKELANKYNCTIGLRKLQSSGFGCSWTLPVLAYHEIPETCSEAKLIGFSDVSSIPMHVIKNWGRMEQDKLCFEVTYEIKAV